MKRHSAEWKTRKKPTAAHHMHRVLQDGKHGGNLSQVVNEIPNSVCFKDGPASSTLVLGCGLHERLEIITTRYREAACSSEVFGCRFGIAGNSVQS